jgi:protein-tyrosine phosphatase
LRQITGFQIWIGHVGDIRNSSAVLDAGILAVVDLALNEVPATLPRELVYCRFPLVDGTGNPRWLLRAAVQTVASLVRAGTPTLVCCSAGMSRSPAIVGAAIAVIRGCSFREGLVAALKDGAGDVSPELWADIQASVP